MNMPYLPSAAGGPRNRFSFADCLPKPRSAAGARVIASPAKVRAKPAPAGTGAKASPKAAARPKVASRPKPAAKPRPDHNARLVAFAKRRKAARQAPAPGDRGAARAEAALFQRRADLAAARRRGDKRAAAQAAADCRLIALALRQRRRARAAART